MCIRDRRVADVGPVVHACVEMVRQQHREAPELVAMVLAVLQRYADWVDIGLVVSQELISLLYQLLRGAPPTASRILVIISNRDPENSPG